MGSRTSLVCVCVFTFSTVALSQVLSSPGYLQLTLADARLGQRLMQKAMQRIMDEAQAPSPITPLVV